MITDDPANSTLAICLSAAVPLKIAEYQRRGGPDEEDFIRTREYADVLGGKGDTLQYTGKKGDATRLFNGLADALAVMAFCPGGVKFAGARYQAHEKPLSAGVQAAPRDSTG